MLILTPQAKLAIKLVHIQEMRELAEKLRREGKIKYKK